MPPKSQRFSLLEDYNIQPSSSSTNQNAGLIIAFDPRSRWILILYLVKLFWRHWREEFLAILNTQRKWREATDNLKVVDVVFVVDQNAPIGRW